ncbi:MAG: XdhC/CoxI family protein [Thermocladium sp.]
MEKGKIVALCIVVDKVGSAPRDVGAMMAVTSDGEKIGTIGGYETEEPIINMVMNSIKKGEYTAKRLVINFGTNTSSPSEEVLTGHICGGKFTVLITFLLPIEKLMIVGSGNVARALGSLAAAVGMKSMCIDDNLDSLREVEKLGIEAISDDNIENALHKAFSMVNEADSIVIAHGDIDYDYLALREAIKTKAQYIGVLAGKRKVSEFIKKLREDGISEASLVGRVFMPAGLDIGSDDPREIAVSIIAEIIRKKKGVKDWGMHLDLINRIAGRDVR